MNNLATGGILLSLALIFVVLGYLFYTLKNKYCASRLTKDIMINGSGVLSCFRHMIIDVGSDGKHEEYYDYQDNNKDYYPVIKFKVDDMEVTERLETPTSILTRNDIGRELSICYTDTPYLLPSSYDGDANKKYRVVIDTDEYWSIYNSYITKQGDSYDRVSKLMYVLGIILCILVHFV